MLSLRFAVCAALLAAFCRLRGRPLMPARGDLLPILLLGAVVYTAETSFFFAAIDRGSASAVIIIVYLYPAFVTVFEAIGRRKWPSPRLVRVLGLSVVGCALVAGAGGQVQLEALGLVFALGAATTFALWVFLGERVGRQTDAMVTAVWVSVGASLVLAAGSFAGSGNADIGGHWPALVGNGVANALAFWMMFRALDLLGAARASVVLTLEVVFTVMLSVALLDESLAPLQVAGAAAVLLAAVVMFGSRDKSKDILDPAAPPVAADY